MSSASSAREITSQEDLSIFHAGVPNASTGYGQSTLDTAATQANLRTCMLAQHSSAGARAGRRAPQAVHGARLRVRRHADQQRVVRTYRAQGGHTTDSHHTILYLSRVTPALGHTSSSLKSSEGIGNALEIHWEWPPQRMGSIMCNKFI